MPLDQIGPYVIEKKIGAGGMGTVYLAHHKESGQEAAVKVLPASLAREEGFVARFNREIDAMRMLVNPHVVQLFDSGVDEETYYYAMEYVDGETLTNRLRREKRIPWQEVIDLSVQICSALKAAHDAGIIHRDLKPSNLLLTRDGQVKLTDFGVAQVFAGSKLTKTGGIIGTAEYMSPEQAKGARATKRSDLYSLGAVMYVMVTGRPPFSGRTTMDVIQKHQYGQFERPRLLVPEIPIWLEDIICQLLEKDPDKRIPDAYVLSRKLQEVVAKVELSRQDVTSATGASTNHTAATIAVDGSEAPYSGPGQGTLMRDLLRAEIEHSLRKSPISEALNNTWVLVGALALLIAGGIWWFQRGTSTPEERFKQAVALVEDGDDSDLDRAKDEFEQLVKADEANWKSKAEPYLQQIEVRRLELKISGVGRDRRSGPPEDDLQRLLKFAEHAYAMGNFAEAERLWNGVATLLADQPEYEPIRQVILTKLEEVKKHRADTPERYRLLKRSMARADELAAAGKLNDAKQIWQSIVELYEPDSEAAAEVKQARERLAAAPAEPVVGAAPAGNGGTEGP